MAQLPIFRYYDIDEEIHSSSDGQKLETQFSTIRSRHSPKYFGLKKGMERYSTISRYYEIDLSLDQDEKKVTTIDCRKQSLKETRDTLTG